MSISPLASPFGRQLAPLLIVFGALLPRSVLADALQVHLSRYHQGYSVDASPELLRKVRLAAVGYGAKQGLKSVGVDHRQVKRFYRRISVHPLTRQSALLLEPNRINLQTRYFDGSLVTELSGKSDGEIGLSFEIPF